MSTNDDWWLIVRTPDSVHLWPVGETPADDQVALAIDLVDGRHDHLTAGRDWDVSLTHGLPRGHFLPDETPRLGVTLHDAAELTTAR